MEPVSCTLSCPCRNTLMVASGPGHRMGLIVFYGPSPHTIPSPQPVSAADFSWRRPVGLSSFISDGHSTWLDIAAVIRTKWHEWGFFIRHIDATEGLRHSNLEYCHPYDALSNPTWTVDWTYFLSAVEIEFVRANLDNFLKLPECQAPDPPTQRCAVCSRTAKKPAPAQEGQPASTAERIKLRKCERCRAVLYCSTECQTKAWRDGHKRVCRAPESALRV